MASFESRGASVRAIVRIAGAKKTATFDTLAEAQAWAARMEHRKAVEQTSGARGSSVTAGEMFEAFEAEAGKMDSAKWNLLRLRKWQLDPIAEMRIGAIVTHDVNQWAQRALARGLSAATVRREMNLMSSAFNWAKGRTWISVNPVHGADRLVGFQKPRRPSAITQRDIVAICQASGFSMDPRLTTKSARACAAWLLSLETGMRSGEILRLRPAHYLRDRSTAHVSAEERGGRKGSRSGRATVDPSRDVPLTERAIELLDLLLETMPEGQQPKEGMMQPPYIVGLDDSQRDALWRKARDKAGVTQYTYHDSKHEACTRLSKFLDVLDLSHAIGTKDIRLLRDTYYINDASAAAAKLPKQLVGSFRRLPKQQVHEQGQRAAGRDRHAHDAGQGDRKVDPL